MNGKMAFVIFFSVVLTVYALVNYYIYTRGLQALPAQGGLKPVYAFAFWTLAATYVAGRFMERVYLSTFSDVLVWTGSFWLAAMLFFFLLAVFFDLLRLVNHVIPFFPAFIRENMPQVRQYVFAGSLVLVTTLLIAGHINARNPVVRNVSIDLWHKETNGMESLNAVLLSDIHLGTLIGNGQFQRIVDRVRQLEPEIIFLAGDILDEDLEPVIRQNIGVTLRELHAPLGVYGVMGNHEHIGGAKDAYEYLVSHGIQIIRDDVVKIGNAFYLAGREDRDKQRFTGRKRKPLANILADVDHRYPVILMDHQPFYLEKAARLGVDLQLSGHTHHGQIWPLNFITQAMYTISHGYGNVDGMHAYVSSGVGTWGPPVRIGNRPEIVNLHIRFAREEGKSQ